MDNEPAAAHAVRETVARLCQEGVTHWTPTGLDRNFYLDMAEAVVRPAAEWVDAAGVVIDPYKKAEAGQSTPRFVAAASILLRFGRLPDMSEAVYRVMDSCAARLPVQGAAPSPDFWMRELATAWFCLRDIAPDKRLAGWREALAGVDPERVYVSIARDGKTPADLHNWTVYSAAGEVMREAAGLAGRTDFLCGRAFFEKYMPPQLHHFTELGMYRDPGDPLTYDITTRLQFACALACGYDGTLRGPLSDALRRGALTMLLYLSPEGYVPFGGRSSQFNFQEAMVATLCEFEARRYRDCNPALAGAFKRQARRSAQAAARWILGMRPFRNLKSGFAPELEHGLDGYASYSVYGLLSASFFGLAALMADDTIPEAPCPAEIGGFSLELAPAFHMVFANAGGYYAQIDTAANTHYDATGLGRYCRTGVPLELGLPMPFASHPAYRLGTGVLPAPEAMAAGPAWCVDGGWTALAGLSDGLTHELCEDEASSACLRMRLAMHHAPTNVGIEETLALSPEGIELAATVQCAGAAPERCRLMVPLLVTDGTERSEIRLETHGATVRYRGCRCVVAAGTDCAVRLDEAEYANRNAVYRSLVIECAGGAIHARLSLYDTP